MRKDLVKMRCDMITVDGGTIKRGQVLEVAHVFRTRSNGNYETRYALKDEFGAVVLTQCSASAFEQFVDRR